MNPMSVHYMYTDEPNIRIYMYLRLAFLAALITITMSNHVPDLLPSPTKNIALVKYNDVVYQCQEIVATKCGYSLHCTDMFIHCANDIVIERI